MADMKRRAFLGGALGLGAITLARPAAALPLKFAQIPQSSSSLDSRIDILVTRLQITLV